MPYVPPAPAVVAQAVLTNNWRLLVTATVWSSPSPGPQVQLSTKSITCRSGTITIDRSNTIRRSGSLDVMDPIGEGWLPTSLSSLIAPNGNELHLAATIYVPAPGGGFSVSPPIPLGSFAITDVELNDTGDDLEMKVTFMDRAWAINERVFGVGGFPAGATLPTNYSLFQMIGAVVENQYPGIPRNISGINNVQTPLTSFAEGEAPFDKMRSAISQSALGYELFLDANGVLTGYPTPDPRMATPAWTFIDGPTQTASRIQRKLTRVGIANDFIMSSAGTTTKDAQGPFRGEAKDDLPSSPTWIGSQFGKIYNFSSSAFVTSEATGNAAAAEDLTEALGQTDILTIEGPPLPFLDVDNVVTVTRSRLGLSAANYVIDAIELPFRHDATMTITARSVVAGE